jgi:hypothetical protein
MPTASILVHHAVVAAVKAGMILVARDQQESTNVAIGAQSCTRDLASVIDVCVVSGQVEIGAGWNKPVQTDDGSVVPKSRIFRTCRARIRGANNLTPGIDRSGLAAIIALQSPKVCHYTCLPNEPMISLIVLSIRSPDNFA